MATDKIQTGLRLENEVLDKITYIAKKEKRSLNAQIEFLIQQAIDKYEKEHGIINLSNEGG